MNPWINYHHLYYFKTIAEEGSVSKAAKKLRIGQPTLSAQLKQFENNIDVILFERKNKRMVITEQGKIAFDYAKNIFEIGSEMYEVLHEHTKPQKTRLHIGCLDSIPKHITAKITQMALKIAPCQITLSEANADELLRELIVHRMDLILTNFIPSGIDAKGIYPKLITKNNLSIYAAPKFKHLKKDFPQSISGQPLVSPTYNCQLRPDLEHWANLNDVDLNIIVESQDVAVKKLLAAKGIGLIATAKYTVTNLLAKKELIEIGKLRGVHEEVYLLTAKRKIPNPIATEILEHY